MKFGFDWPYGFRGEIGDDGRTAEHDHPITSLCEPLAQVS